MKKLLYLFTIILFTFSCNQKKTDWIDNKTSSKSNENRVEEFLKARTNVKNYKILYTKKENDLHLINLVKNLDDENDYYFIINGFRNNYEYQIRAYQLKNL